MGLEYEPHLVNIRKNENYTAEFIKINPNSKVPAIIDPDGPDGSPMTVFESGAILLYLAEKSNKFLSRHPRHRWETVQWVMFQMAGVGPMFGQYAHFSRFAKDKCLDPYPTQRYAAEVLRLFGVVEQRLQGRQFIIDDGYSIADMNMVPWIRFARTLFADTLDLDQFPLVSAWADRCFARPAFAKGVEVLSLGLPV
jgi:GST-like protein